MYCLSLSYWSAGSTGTVSRPIRNLREHLSSGANFVGSLILRWLGLVFVTGYTSTVLLYLLSSYFYIHSSILVVG